jgi:hypothetical protein
MFTVRVDEPDPTMSFRAIVIMGAPLDPPWPHRQTRLWRVKLSVSLPDRPLARNNHLKSALDTVSGHADGLCAGQRQARNQRGQNEPRMQ